MLVRQRCGRVPHDSKQMPRVPLVGGTNGMCGRDALLLIEILRVAGRPGHAVSHDHVTATLDMTSNGWHPESHVRCRRPDSRGNGKSAARRNSSSPKVNTLDIRMCDGGCAYFKVHRVRTRWTRMNLIASAQGWERGFRAAMCVVLTMSFCTYNPMPSAICAAFTNKPHTIMVKWGVRNVWKWTVHCVGLCVLESCAAEVARVRAPVRRDKSRFWPTAKNL